MLIVDHCCGAANRSLGLWSTSACLLTLFQADKMLHTTNDETFELMFKVHNLAPFRILREAAPYFRIKDASKRGNRSIVNVSSTSGCANRLQSSSSSPGSLHGNSGQANYATGKAGVIGS